MPKKTYYFSMTSKYPCNWKDDSKILLKMMGEGAFFEDICIALPRRSREAIKSFMYRNELKPKYKNPPSKGGHKRGRSYMKKNFYTPQEQSFREIPYPVVKAQTVIGTRIKYNGCLYLDGKKISFRQLIEYVNPILSAKGLTEMRI